MSIRDKVQDIDCDKLINGSKSKKTAAQRIENALKRRKRARYNKTQKRKSKLTS